MSYRNQEYWNNKNEMAKKAQEHYLNMEQMFIDEIKYSEENSMMFSDISYDYDIFKPKLNNGKQNIEVIVDDIDTVSAIFKYKEGKTAVLNFASYKHPGGMFLKGSSAQEESLCHHSTLFNVLKRFALYYKWNSEHLNKALYTNRAIVSPNILFFNPSTNSNYRMCCDVITCAAPNKHAAQKYQRVTDEENTIALGGRIAFVMDIANYLNVETLILGAYGCGVFGQDPYQVSMMFKQYIDNISCSFNKVVFAIPSSFRNNNLEAFRKTFHK